MFLISDLCTILESYLSKSDIESVYKAYLFGAEAHSGQTRKSGEPYIYHPIAVARILAELRMDSKTLVAAILHDVIEDTPTAKEQIVTAFGQEVADIVDGLTKLDHIRFNSKAEAKAESFRKLILSMVKDLRVILIKLADRLHNMRTLGVMSTKKARRIAEETLEVYAPIANRLGMNNIRHELEDLGFKSYHPMRYRVLSESINKIRGNRKEIVNKIRLSLEHRLREEGIDCKVLGREKHLYSIYTKMRKKQLPFLEVFDVYAFRIIVSSVDQCYRALGIVHNLYKPVPGKFKDYIAIPKVNGYQSLHSVLFSPYGVSLEVQIRTDDMHKVAEQGVASHWVYKTEEKEDTAVSGKKDTIIPLNRTRKWLKSLLEIQKHTGDSIEFLENVKIDLFPDEVYVFTPKGKIMELPRGATAVDFAYAVHTGVGDSCTGIKINHKLMPLNTILHNGQTIEVIISKGSQPNPLWLNFVVTAKARGNIRHTLKHLQEDEAIVLGERLLNKCLSRVDMSIFEIDQHQLDLLLKEYRLASLDELLYELGMGNRVPQLVARRLIPQKLIDEEDNKCMLKSGNSLAIKGTEGTVVSYAKCCYPIPGDDIIGYLSTGRGLVMHTRECSNAGDYLKKPEKWVELEWSHEVKGDFSVSMRILAEHKKGVLANVAAIISENEANIEQVTTTQKEGNYSLIDFVLTVKSRDHLAKLMRKLRVMEYVAKISRS
ncbi:MAG: RelA/SpoT family protein [Pseudomonadota bacterium]